MLVAVGLAVSMAPAPPPPKCNPETHVPAEYAIKEGDVPLIFLPQNDVRSRALPKNCTAFTAWCSMHLFQSAASHDAHEHVTATTNCFYFPSTIIECASSSSTRSVSRARYNVCELTFQQARSRAWCTETRMLIASRLHLVLILPSLLCAQGDASPACLDGSPYGFYFQPSTTGSTKWTISINGIADISIAMHVSTSYSHIGHVHQWSCASVHGLKQFRSPTCLHSV